MYDHEEGESERKQVDPRTERLQCQIDTLKWTLGAVRALETMPESNFRQKTLFDVKAILEDNSSIEEITSQNAELKRQVNELNLRVKEQSGSPKSVTTPINKSYCASCPFRKRWSWLSFFIGVSLVVIIVLINLY